jgi:hypothetical protein
VPIIWDVSSGVLDEDVASIFRASEFGSCGQSNNEGKKICRLRRNVATLVDHVTSRKFLLSVTPISISIILVN